MVSYQHLLLTLSGLSPPRLFPSYLARSHLAYSHLAYTHLACSHLAYSRLACSHLAYSQVAYSHLVRYTQVRFHCRCHPPDQLVAHHYVNMEG